MPKKEQNTKERIINATLELLTTEAIEDITVRKIAQKAKVNIAAINYHFSSKEKLILHAVIVSTKAGRDLIINFVSDTAVSPEERLRKFVDFYGNILADYPNQSRIAIMADMRAKDPEVIASFPQSKTLSKALLAVLSQIAEKASENLLRNTLVQLESAITLPFLLADSIHAGIGFDFSDAEQRKEYLNFVVESAIRNLETFA